ncbi:MAG: hypothetical protein DRO14_00355 [Thermoprotei archaeon]|nr:MAG: hypothetical protein DRO14_00080 [Thermoprotei archaeon]RLG78600.1 MAG: hypothetical protein DRO14_00355 [Thermoprotei archaeon]
MEDWRKKECENALERLFNVLKDIRAKVAEKCKSVEGPITLYCKHALGDIDDMMNKMGRGSGFIFEEFVGVCGYFRSLSELLNDDGFIGMRVGLESAFKSVYWDCCRHNVEECLKSLKEESRL